MTTSKPYHWGVDDGCAWRQKLRERGESCEVCDWRQKDLGEEAKGFPSTWWRRLHDSRVNSEANLFMRWSKTLAIDCSAESWSMYVCASWPYRAAWPYHGASEIVSSYGQGGRWAIVVNKPGAREEQSAYLFVKRSCMEVSEPCHWILLHEYLTYVSHPESGLAPFSGVVSHTGDAIWSPSS